MLVTVSISCMKYLGAFARYTGRTDMCTRQKFDVLITVLFFRNQTRHHHHRRLLEQAAYRQICMSPRALSPPDQAPPCHASPCFCCWPPPSLPSTCGSCLARAVCCWAGPQSQHCKAGVRVCVCVCVARLGPLCVFSSYNQHRRCMYTSLQCYTRLYMCVARDSLTDTRIYIRTYI